MSNGSPPARRRPPSGTPSGGAGARPATRRPSPSARPAPVTASPRLVCVAGPKSGEEFQLEDGEYVIGRATDNPICIPDTSVSRKHVMVRKSGGGWTVSDLGSGNGTLVNGDAIGDETPLANGDVITLGDTELRFEDVANSTNVVSAPARSRPGASAAPAAGRGGAPSRPAPRGEGGRVRSARSTANAPPDPEAQKKKLRLMMLGGGVVLVLLLGLGFLKMRAVNQEALALAERGVMEAERKSLSKTFQDAKNLVREGKWVEAKALLEEVQSRAPEYPGVKDYLDHAEREIPVQGRLADAREALTKMELGKAAAALAKAGESQFLYEQVNAAKRELSELADKRTREARTALDGGQLDQAKVITDDVLKAFPEHRDAKLINEEAVRAIAARDAPKPVITGPAPKPWEPAVERFRDGDMSGAVSILNACMSKTPQCKKLLAQITEFGGLYKRIEDLDAKGLSKLLALDKDITEGRTSKMARNAGTRAATIFYKSASGAKAAGQWARAMEYSRRALQAEPGHAGASNIISELKTKAKDLYLQAYSLKDGSPEDALPKFKDVVAMTPPDDEYHDKAKTWVEKLSR
ncbi:FHA domain-containing protein [Myxococcus stipitatus DSM 14675]|uniref:FHA domain-containing protein n=1 Tax=Myxococcus stipitatus (strain DSM 14675 / JCM 12634 / Mx s8) TaxID=1278073 RepID=L7UET6_MYXSD|nr:FHA domain-containing protein [Myxococcus stipitatus]AGC46385.1 FHA domain-containing protein [Myxococcus stipitatus DSM 14675]